MFENYFSKHLKEGEEAILIVRRYNLTFAPHLILSLVIVFSAFFFLYPLFRLGRWGVFIFIMLIFFGLLYFFRQSVIYFLNALVITKQRLIDFDQKGLFNRVVSETTYDKIQDVSFKINGFTPTLFNYGDLEIQTAGTQANLEIKSIANPKKIQDVIIRLQTEIVKVPQDLTAKDLVDLVTRIKEGLGEEKFKELMERSSDQTRKKSK
ncbi:MAG: PH domain-containing protein [Patescibacteria group bacterium]|nr:PH domain-containing protein [Patescibacteria group bacterium]